MRVKGWMRTKGYKYGVVMMRDATKYWHLKYGLLARYSVEAQFQILDYGRCISVPVQSRHSYGVYKG